MRLRTVFFWAAVLVVLLPGMLLTFTRVVEPAGGRWIRLESFTPFGMFLYLIALVLLVARALRTRSRLTGAVAVVAAAGLAAHVWWYSPMVSGANPPPREGAETLRVMTANVYAGQGDGVALVEAVADEDIDLLVVPEIEADQLAAMESAGIDDLLPHRIGEPAEGGAGTMVFARGSLGEPRLLDTTWDSWVVQMGDVTVLAVHPVSPTHPAGWRQDHATVLAAAEESDADLIVGDLNATVDHEPMRRAGRGGLPLRDRARRTRAGSRPGRRTGSWTWAACRCRGWCQIDHVLVRRHFAALGSHTVAIPGTDHSALVAEVAER